jgi:hypothetical protein
VNVFNDFSQEWIGPLYELQDEILSALSGFAEENGFPFVLTGGTALVRFILKSPYRISYDLDFFSTREFSIQELENVINFLSRNFCVQFKSQSGIAEIPIYKYEISSQECSIKIDFVQDIFCGIFTPSKLPGTVLNMDSADAIYFRKIYTLLSSSVQGIIADRIKDTLDLIQLDTRIKPFTKYVAEDFCEIWKQNIPREITPLHVLKSLKKLFFEVEEKSEEIEKVLQEVYFSKVTTGEILKWLRQKIEELSLL